MEGQQELTIKVYDSDSNTADDFLGGVTVRIPNQAGSDEGRKELYRLISEKMTGQVAVRFFTRGNFRSTFMGWLHPETWYVQVDCYFFTEDLRQFSFGRIGVLKEV